MAAFDPDAYLNKFDPDKYLGEDDSPYSKYVRETLARGGQPIIPTSEGVISHYPPEEPLSEEEWESEQNKKLLRNMGESAVGLPDAGLSFAAKLPGMVAGGLAMPYIAARKAIDPEFMKGYKTEELGLRIMGGPSWTDPKTDKGRKYLENIGIALEPYGPTPYANIGHAAARAAVPRQRGAKPTAPVVKPIPPQAEAAAVNPNQLYLDNVPEEIKTQQHIYNNESAPFVEKRAPARFGDLTNQDALPFEGGGPEAIRAEQLRNEPTGDMFNDLYQQQKAFDPYQENLQKQADLDTLELQKAADEGVKQKEIDDAFVSRQKQLFEEEQRTKQDAEATRLEEGIEQPLREGRGFSKSQLGGIHPDLVNLGVSDKIIDLFKKYRVAQSRPSVADDPYLASTGNKAASTRAFNNLYKELQTLKNPDVAIQQMFRIADYEGVEALGRTDPVIGSLDPYWEAQAKKHEKTAESLRKRYLATGEKQWLKQAISNEERAWKLRNAPANKISPVNKQRGAIDMDAVFRGVVNLKGKRVVTNKGVGEVVGHKIALIKNRDKLTAKFNELHDEYYKGETFDERHNNAKAALDKFMSDEYPGWPRDTPTGRYSVKYQDGTVDHFVYGSDIKNVLEGPQGIINKQRGAIDLDAFRNKKENAFEREQADSGNVDAFWKSLYSGKLSAGTVLDYKGKRVVIKEVGSGARYVVEDNNGNIHYGVPQDALKPYGINKQVRALNHDRGVLDIDAIGEAFKKLRGLKSDSPELTSVKLVLEEDRKREFVYNSIPGLDPFRPIWDTPEKVLASLNDPKAKDLGPMQRITAQTTKPGIRTVRVANNNPLVAYRQHTAMKTFTGADALARQYLTNKDTIGPMWEKFSKDEKVQIHRLLEQGSQELRRFSVEEMTEAGYTPKQIEFMEKFAAAWDAKLDIWNENLLSIGKEPVAPRPGYIPGVFSGDFWSLAMDGDKIVGFVGTNTKAGYNAVIKGLKEKTPTLTFTPMKRRGLTGSFRRSDLAQGMRDIMAVLGKNDPKIEQFRQIIQQVENEKANSWLGADLHALNKKGIWGNEGNKPWQTDAYGAADEAMKSYLAAWEEGVLSHLNLKPNADLTALTQNPEVMTKWERAVDYVNTYTNYMTGQHTNRLGTTLNNIIDMTLQVVSFDQLGPHGARAGINQYTKRMGQLTQGFGNIPYMAMQMIQPAMTAFPEMFRAGNSTEVGASIGVGFIDGITYVRKKLGEDVKITPDQAEMYAYAENVGLLTFSEFDDVSKVTQGKLARGLDTAIDFNRRAGELSTRPYVFFTMVDLLRKHETIPASEILDTAYNLTQYSMTDYSPAERALMYQKMGVAGQLAGSLTQFKHSWVNQNVQWLKDAPKKPQMAIAGLVGMAALAGYRGMPGYDDLDSMVKYITNKWGDKQVSIADIIAAQGPEWLSKELPAFGAASALSGINISSRLGSAQLLPESPLEAVSPYMGKTWKIGENIAELGENPKAPYNLMRELAPSSVRNLLDDQFDIEPYKNDEGELINPKKPFTTMTKDAKRDVPISQHSKDVRKWGIRSLAETQEKDKVYQGQSRQLTDEARRGQITSEVNHKATQLGQKWVESEEFVKLKNEYIRRGGDPVNLINSMIKAKMDSKLTGKQRAEGINPSDISSTRRYQNQNP